MKYDIRQNKSINIILQCTYSDSLTSACICVKTTLISVAWSVATYIRGACGSVCDKGSPVRCCRSGSISLMIQHHRRFGPLSWWLGQIAGGDWSQMRWLYGLNTRRISMRFSLYLTRIITASDTMVCVTNSWQSPRHSRLIGSDLYEGRGPRSVYYLTVLLPMNDAYPCNLQTNMAQWKTLAVITSRSWPNSLLHT